ncbi:unnamed protein product [marine sediment metagenome]|uniref:Uncharacterized protein n=1 Tax=marine sediment metagenome TaxID=412755 RepID=X0TL98_9ZZZZ
MHSGKMYYRQAGQFVGSLAGQGDYLVTDSVWVLHYARISGSQLSPGTENIDALIGQLRQTPATHLALTEGVMARGGIRSAIGPPAFQPLQQFAPPTAKRVRTIDVFKISRDELSDLDGS